MKQKELKRKLHPIDVALVVIVLTVILTITGMEYYRNAGTKIFEKKLSFEDFKNDSLAISVDSILIPNELNACEIEIFISTNITEKYDGYVNVEIFDDEEKSAGNFEGEIYYDLGSDWKERKTKNSQIFRLKDGGGIFHADIYLHKDILLEVYQNSPDFTSEVYFRVYTPEKLLSRYFENISIGLFGCIFVLGIGVTLESWFLYLRDVFYKQKK